MPFEYEGDARTITCGDPYPDTCNDGTPKNSCSGTQPFFCDQYARLEADAATCGCPSGQEIDPAHPVACRSTSGETTPTPEEQPPEEEVPPASTGGTTGDTTLVGTTTTQQVTNQTTTIVDFCQYTDGIQSSRSECSALEQILSDPILTGMTVVIFLGGGFLLLKLMKGK